jgi:hypothetical protein
MKQLRIRNTKIVAEPIANCLYKNQNFNQNQDRSVEESELNESPIGLQKLELVIDTGKIESGSDVLPSAKGRINDGGIMKQE